MRLILRIFLDQRRGAMVYMKTVKFVLVPVGPQELPAL